MAETLSSLASVEIKRYAMPPSSKKNNKIVCLMVRNSLLAAVDRKNAGSEVAKTMNQKLVLDKYCT